MQIERNVIRHQVCRLGIVTVANLQHAPVLIEDAFWRGQPNICPEITTVEFGQRIIAGIPGVRLNMDRVRRKVVGGCLGVVPVKRCHGEKRCQLY